MPSTNKPYAGLTFLFPCRNCKVMHNLKIKKVEFAFMRSQKKGYAVLKCKKCGLLISRAKRFLDEQMENQENENKH